MPEDPALQVLPDDAMAPAFQKIDMDPEQQLYTPKIENIAVIDILETSEALNWIGQQQQQKIDMDPEQHLYTPKIEDIAAIEMYGDI
ncbi:hypothetical protein LAZ67_12000660 [Cordylochernes scorpioides]|uniref:Uncharacterized protein n=1 Tax=Cordylochernes scorpioides TaxID=51811 RepID=A0ABY6L0Q8_9ARAC|nr:hypothetical protein LAZ67_12000660 [Cordylochernes scorpioides]